MIYIDEEFEPTTLASLIDEALPFIRAAWYEYVEDRAVTVYWSLAKESVRDGTSSIEDHPSVPRAIFSVPAFGLMDAAATVRLWETELRGQLATKVEPK